MVCMRRLALGLIHCSIPVVCHRVHHGIVGSSAAAGDGSGTQAGAGLSRPAPARFGSTAISTKRSGRRPSRSSISSRPNRSRATRRPTGWRSGFSSTRPALWIGARMDTPPGARIQAPMSRRDDGEQAEYLQIELDTYLDRRTAYMFGVTASGVRLDHFHPTDNQDDIRPAVRPGLGSEDRPHRRRLDRRAVDPVLAAAVQRSAGARLGAERQALAAGAERGGLLGGHRPHRQGAGRRGSASCAASTASSRGCGSKCCRTSSSSSRMTGNRDRNNPFDDGMNLTGRVGGDVKVGLGLEPDARGDDQSRLRPGRSRSRRSEPDGVRDHLRRAAAVLHRRQQRARGRHQQLLLLAAHRRAAAQPASERRRRQRLCRLPGHQHDPRRGQAHRPPQVRHLGRLPRRGHQQRGGAPLERPASDRRSTSPRDGLGRRPHHPGVRHRRARPSVRT